MAGIADKVIDSQNKEEMLLRALERIIQLYTDKSHFVYELLQNAEDAEARNIKFIQYSDRLEVMHDGKPFTLENLKGLCDIGKSDKVKNLNQIGEFGVGFKSVFGICDTVRLYSEPANFRDVDVGTAEAFSVEILNFTDPQAMYLVSDTYSFAPSYAGSINQNLAACGWNNIGVASTYPLEPEEGIMIVRYSTLRASSTGSSYHCGADGVKLVIGY